ncbi:MAG: GNAT family N-acetyltransferase [Dehalococcoidia bacterium]|nr:GNAT family N-acetyltransferase [Dehalococcoidia bacterium]
MPTEPADAPERPIITIEGDRVALGPLRRDLVPLYQRWLNDPEVCRTLGASLRPVTLEDEQRWYEGRVGKPDSAVFQVYLRDGWRPIGTTGLESISHQHRTADFGILIGEQDCWDQGYGTETTRLMLDYAFNVLGLHNVLLRVYDYNSRGIRAYEKAGFKLIGRQRQALRLGGEAHDIVLMDSIATEFDSPLLRRLFVEGRR